VFQDPAPQQAAHQEPEDQWREHHKVEDQPGGQREHHKVEHQPGGQREHLKVEGLHPMLLGVKGLNSLTLYRNDTLKKPRNMNLRCPKMTTHPWSNKTPARGIAVGTEFFAR
jgi:hypothetical protein